MKHFAGLDVSLEETAICVVDETGTMVREARVSSEPEALVAFFRGLGLVVERIGLEACSLSAWLHESLVAASLPAVCIETRRAKAAMGAMPNKTDRNDARGLAQIIRTGWYRAVHVKSPTCRSWRALLTARRLVLNKMRDLENGLRALLREAGLKLGTPARKELAARVRELTAADPVLSVLAELKPGRELHTNVEFYAGVVMELCGLPRAMFTPTFSVARVIGWSANVLEQALDSKIIRPSSRYVGPPPPQPVPSA